MAVGEAFLSAFLQVLFDRLASPQLLEFARQEGLEEKLEKLSKMWSRTQAVRDDAEEKRYDNVDVREWLEDMLDAEDMLDEFDAEVSRKFHEASAGEAQNSISGMVIGCTQIIVDTFSGGLPSKIQEIIDRFDGLVQRKDELKLGERVDGSGSDRKREIPEPTSVATEPCVYGREKETEELLQLLLDEKDSEPTFSSIAIVGMGGIGKTTLAQHVYKHDKVQNAFQLRVWAYVSEDFNIVSVTKTILGSINYSKINVGDDLNSLQVKLIEELKGKKFLVILDDLWDENYPKWITLCAPFEEGASGSKIVITTRHQEVARMVGSPSPCRLKELPKDACFSLFTRHALRASDFRAHPNLKDIGEKIVEKCKGLPLAAMILGGLLRRKQNRDEWEKVLKNEIWNIKEKKGGILPYLMLSYHYLPSHLKRCFQYCSIFPKGYEFEEEELVLLWMAEGLIQPQQDTKPEDLGREYFRDLLSRSFFQQSTASNSRFLMHDFINDLAQYVARDTYCRLDGTIYDKEKFCKRARHFSCSAGGFKRAGISDALSKLTRLRTFLSFDQVFTCHYWSNKVLCSLINKPYLRVLSLRGLNIVELPDSIDDLRLLRYLDLSSTPIRSLPVSTTTLYNLQTLILEGCYELKELPSTFGNLVNLCHLNILFSGLEGMPPQLGKLTSLQTLSDFVVGESECGGIKELGLLLHLQGKLKISKLENVIEPEDALEANLIGKANLDELELEWGDALEDNLDEFEWGRIRYVSQEKTILMETVLERLQPPKGLKRLTLKDYGGTRFSTWLSDPLFPNMVSLNIVDCESCTSLPSIGQLPSLEFLSISGMHGVKNIGPEFYGKGCTTPFGSLKRLHFRDMREWEKWIPHREFPRLCEISIQYCPKLEGKLPTHHFPNSCKVEIDSCKGVVQDKKVYFKSLLIQSSSQIERFNTEDLTTIEKLSIHFWREIYKDLRPLWSNEVGLLQHLPHLRLLEISGSDKLVSLVSKEVEDQIRGMPLALRELSIRKCNTLISLPKIMYNQTCLEKIDIVGCNSLRHFAIGELPPTLKLLWITQCEKMLYVFDKDDIHSDTNRKHVLMELRIDGCPSLISITSNGQLPATKRLYIRHCRDLNSICNSPLDECNSPLEDIHIVSCESLKSLPMGMHNLRNLEILSLESCSSLVCFTDGEFLPASLIRLLITDSEKIQGLPNRFYSLTSLRDLVILNCPGIVSFPEEGFPRHLTKLMIWNVNINEALFEWGLQKLSSLEHLEIVGGSPDLVSFPKGTLPDSLTRLTISNFPNLTELSSRGFQNLKSLRMLEIKKCEKLSSFPEDGLPRSLESLYISDCPLLEEHCEEDKGREWNKLTHIPDVRISYFFYLNRTFGRRPPVAR